MQAETFLSVIKQLGNLYPNAELYATDDSASVGTFETMYLEVRVDTDKKMIWIIFDAEDGSPVKLKDLITDLEQMVTQHPGFDIVFEDCFGGKNTFETYFTTFNIDEDDNTIEIQFYSDGTYEKLGSVYKDAMRIKYRAIQRAGNILCGYCEVGDCESCIVQRLVDCAANECGIDLTGVYHDDEDEDVEADDEYQKLLNESYAKYVKAWCAEHNCSPDDIDEDVGISGECYVCIEEFEENEFRDVNVMKEMLSEDEFILWQSLTGNTDENKGTLSEVAEAVSNVDPNLCEFCLELVDEDGDVVFASHYASLDVAEKTAQTLTRNSSFQSTRKIRIVDSLNNVVYETVVSSRSVGNQLIDKVCAEYTLYKSDVLQKRPDQVFEDCFDIVFHKQIVEYVKDHIAKDFANLELTLLLNTDRLLVKLYDLWTDHSELSTYTNEGVKDLFEVLLVDLYSEKHTDSIGENEDQDPAIEVCEYETDERYFVYDSKDICVSGNGFHFEDEAISYANRNGYPTVKIHRYFIDSDRGGKLYPDGEPEIVWKDGKPV